MPQVAVSHWVCVYCTIVPACLEKNEPGWCRGTGLLSVWPLNVNCMGQDSRGEQLSGTELLGKLGAQERASWEQNTVNWTIWVLLPITTPCSRSNDFLVVGYVQRYCFMHAIQLRGENPPHEFLSTSERSFISSDSVVSWHSFYWEFL